MNKYDMLMGIVLFRAAAVSSHYNATFKIAQALKEDYNHRVIYIGNDNFSDMVIANGFEYLPISAAYTRIEVGINQVPQPVPAKNLSAKLNYVFAYFWNIKSLASIQKIRLDNERTFAKLFQELNPALVFIDTFFDYEIPMFYKNNIPHVIYQTKFSSNKEINIPPLTSRFLPSDTKLSSICTEVLWIKYYVISRLKKMKDLFFYMGTDPHATFKKMVRKFSFPNKLLYTKRTFTPAFTHTWEFVLSPLELDFKRNKAPFQIVMGPVVDMNRSDTDYDYSFLAFKEKVLERVKGPKQYIIYCSLGSISDTHSKHCKKFYQRLISVVEKNKNYILALSIGFTYEVKDFNVSEKNVHIFQKVPQMDVLKYSDIMITHGGMQSITECVLSGIPMIVYPLTNSWDQNGNSARIIYHKVGLRGNIRRDSKKSINVKIDKVIKTHEFKSNILELRKKIQESKNFKEGIVFLDSLIKGESISKVPLCNGSSF